MVDDVTRWNTIHQKIHKDEEGHSVYAEEKEKLFPKGSVICDLGGGSGGDAIYFLKQGHSVIVLDISDFALELTRSKAKAVGYADKLVTKHMDFGLHELPIKDNSVDIAYSRLSLHYFGKTRTSEMFNDIYRFIKPNGTAYLTFKSPKDEAEMERLQAVASVYEENVYIEGGQLRSRFTVEQLKQILKDAGIKSCTVNPYQEMLGVKGTGKHELLLQNEVVFTKK
ncbi:class I SAM-dependent methyltransferase [Patescibacteria group bacterium]